MIRIQRDDFDISTEVDALSGDSVSIGAVVTFTGLVRKPSNDSSLTAMTLEHYPDMTQKELERLEAEARRRWPIEKLLIIHRIGRLELGAKIVLVAVAAAHRHAAFEAANFLMDWLKTKAPFWKIEHVASGDRWVEARQSDDHAGAKWS